MKLFNVQPPDKSLASFLKKELSYGFPKAKECCLDNVPREMRKGDAYIFWYRTTGVENLVIQLIKLIACCTLLST